MSDGESEAIFAIRAKNRVGQYLRKNFRRSRTKNEIFRDSAKFAENSWVRDSGTTRSPLAYFDSAILWPRLTGGVFVIPGIFNIFLGNCFKVFS